MRSYGNKAIGIRYSARSKRLATVLQSWLLWNRHGLTCSYFISTAAKTEALKNSKVSPTPPFSVHNLLWIRRREPFNASANGGKKGVGEVVEFSR